MTGWTCSAPAPSQEQPSAALWERFAHPPPAYSPVPIWWWSGERLEPARLRWQLERFVEGGVFNVVILNLAPSGPLYGCEPDDPPFFSSRWWEIFRDVCEQARALGVRIWFYDQLGFSGANLQAQVVRDEPRFCGQSLERVVADADGPVELQCPSGGVPLAAFAIPVDTSGRAVGEPDRLALVDGSARWSGRGPHRVTLVYVVDRGFDYFSPAACERLLARVHGQFEAHVGDLFGATIAGSFQDELPDMPTWSAEFALEFRRRWGYDLVDDLAWLWEDGGDHAQGVRRDYHAHRAILAEEAFFRPLFEWHEARGLLCGFDQQGPARTGSPIDGVRSYADYLRTHRWYGAPGSDHHGDAKIHSSLAHLYGRPRTWLEAFHSTGWGGTLEETFDWMLPWLRAGANLYSPHAFYYSTRGGWWEWAPPATDWRQPYWRHHSVFATAVARLCAVLASGHHVCDIAVLAPTTTVQAGLTLSGPTPAAMSAQDAYVGLIGHLRWYDPTTGALDSLRRDYDVVDDDSLGRAGARGSFLEIGAERYRALILPSCTTLQVSVARRIAEFAEQGGTVIALGQLPAQVLGEDASVVLERLRQLAREGTVRLASGLDELETALGGVPLVVDAEVPILERRVGNTRVLFVPATRDRATRVEPSPAETEAWLQPTYDFDPQRYARHIRVRVRIEGDGGRFQVWEPFSGRKRDLTFDLEDDLATVEVPLSDGPGVLLIYGHDLEPAQPAMAARTVSEQLLETGWESELLPTLDNRWGDFDVPASSEPVSVQGWKFRYASDSGTGADQAADWYRPEFGDSDWKEVHATFGPHGERAGPSVPALLPNPGQAKNGSEGWVPVRYSDSRGLFKDPLHRGMLGPKGYVPEEFLDFGAARRGEAVQFRASLTFPTRFQGFLALGAPAPKRVWINDEELATQTDGYLAFWPVDLEGEVVLSFRLEAAVDVQLRASYAFVVDRESFERPEWLTVAASGGVDTKVSFTRELMIDFRVERAIFHIGSRTPCRAYINDRELGRQGDFDPYFEAAMSSRIQAFDVAPLLRQGANEIRIEAENRGRGPLILLDAVVEGEDRVSWLWSDSHWDAHQAEEVLLIRLEPQPLLDPAWPLARRRPHPLPRSSWLRPDDVQRGVTMVVARPIAERPETGWIRFWTPPGTTTIRLSLHGDPIETFVDGVRGPARLREMADDLCELDIAVHGDGPALCAVRLKTRPGFTEGAALAGPAHFSVGPGRIRLGDWASQGLSSYSGAVWYRQTFRWAGGNNPKRTATLDLGRVRGTAEVRLNGTPLGVRVLSPYLFDLTGALRTGPNRLEVLITNTLAPYLDAVSPTHFVFRGQTDSGLFGPIRVLTHDRAEKGSLLPLPSLPISGETPHLQH